MYMALKTHTSFESEVQLKHDVTAERWAMLIKERMESGMTVREWCHDRDIKESRYYYWLRRLRQDAVKEKERRQQVSPFVELPTDICREQVFEPAAAVIRKGNVTIEVTESASAGFIAKVMEALANAWQCKTIQPDLPGIWLYRSPLWNRRPGQGCTGSFFAGSVSKRLSLFILWKADRPH